MRTVRGDSKSRELALLTRKLLMLLESKVKITTWLRKLSPSPRFKAIITLCQFFRDLSLRISRQLHVFWRGTDPLKMRSSWGYSKSDLTILDVSPSDCH